MTFEYIVLTMGCFFAISLLYSSVGQAGASGYLAVMALLSFPSHEIKPVSLILNIVVAMIGVYRYVKGGFFDKRIFLIFATFSIPMSFLGGAVTVEERFFKIISGLLLLLSAVLLLLRARQKGVQNAPIVAVPIWQAGLVGSVIGFLSGLIGMGGGVFLSPLLLLFSWASPQQISGISSAFILVNSILALIGHLSAIRQVPFHTIYWIIAVLFGGFLGSLLGTRMKNQSIYKVLAIILIIAGSKMLLDVFF